MLCCGFATSAYAASCHFDKHDPGMIPPVSPDNISNMVKILPLVIDFLVMHVKELKSSNLYSLSFFTSRLDSKELLLNKVWGVFLCGVGKNTSIVIH